MRQPAVALVYLASLLAGACDGDNSVRITSTTTDSEARGVLRVVDALQCPETLQSLTRKGSAQAGGTTCVYTGPRGAEVTLHLVRVDEGTADDVLIRFERMLAADMPRTAADLDAARQAEDARTQADLAQARADAAPTDADAAANEARVAAAEADRASIRAPGLSVEAQGDRADVRLPGMSVVADGDKASVRFGGFSINADDSAASVDVSSADESVSVQAHEDAAEIRTRTPGDAIRTTYMLTDSRPADAGWRLVGFEARGPSGGPIVIATVRAKDRDSDGVFDAAKALVTLNVGE